MVDKRARLALDTMRLLSSNGKECEEKELQLMVNRLPSLMTEQLMTAMKGNRRMQHRQLKLTPEQTSQLMHSVGMTYNQKRAMVTVLGKFHSFNPFSGENKMREYEKEVKFLHDRDNIEQGTMLLWRTHSSECTEPCAYVRVTGLDKMVFDLVKLARRDTPENLDKLSLLDLDNPRYQGVLWVVAGGDHGGDTRTGASTQKHMLQVHLPNFSYTVAR
jgi:hypothetical protein